MKLLRLFPFLLFAGLADAQVVRGTSLRLGDATTIADAGAIRLANSALIGWESDPAGTDVTLQVTTGEKFLMSAGLDVPSIGATTPGSGAFTTLTGAVTDKGGQVYNVKAYGATGDGVTNDTAAIQAVIDLSVGADVYLPAGTYKITTLELPSNVVLRGSSRDQTILLSTVSGSTAIIRNKTASAGSTSNVKIADLTIKGTDGNGGTGLWLNSFTQSVFSNLNINVCRNAGNTGRGLYMENQFAVCAVNNFYNLWVQNCDTAITLTSTNVLFATGYNNFFGTKIDQEVNCLELLNGSGNGGGENRFYGLFIQGNAGAGTYLNIEGINNEIMGVTIDAAGSGTRLLFGLTGTEGNRVSFMGGWDSTKFVNNQTTGAANTVDTGVQFTHSPGKEYAMSNDLGDVLLRLGGGAVASAAEVRFGNATSTNLWKLEMQASATPYMTLFKGANRVQRWDTTTIKQLISDVQVSDITATGLTVNPTTEATVGGAGAIITPGGIFATKKIISGSDITSGGLITATSALITTGNSTIGQDARASDVRLDLNSAAGNNRFVAMTTAGSLRWRMMTNGAAEGGADAGSNFSIQAYTDAGASIDEPFRITRVAGGVISLARPLAGTSGTFSGAVSTTALTASGLTAGRVPYISTAGLLADEAAYAYDAGTNTFSAENIAASGTSTYGTLAVTTLEPTTDDGAAIGNATTKRWSDLFLAEGGVINWDNGDATLTQVGNMLTLAGADLTVPGIVGTIAGGSATAGNVGEYIAASVVQGSALALTTATPKTVTSISLTAGDWDITAIGALTGASTGTVFDVAVGTTTDSLTGTVLGDTRCQTPTVSLTGADATMMVPAVRVTIAGTTVYYLIVAETFTVGTPAAYGRLSARRVR